MFANNPMNYSRRDFLSGFTRRLAARLTETAHESANAINAAAKIGMPERSDRPIAKLAFLRPPGALQEPQFLNTCDRECIECLKACPYDAIKRLGSEYAAEGTPAIIPDETPCYLCADLPCIEACPTGALRLTDRPSVKMGLAKIDYGRCYVSQGQPCDYCVVRCPLDRDAIDWDANRLPRVSDIGCSGCGVCSYLCPADAIRIVPA